MTITLEAIKAEQTKITQMIEAFEQQSAEGGEFHFPETLIALQPGEHYAGLIIGKDGEPSYHLVLLPNQADDTTWEKAMTWASQQGGDFTASLPTRREQSLLFANLKEQFEERYYWSCEAHSSESGWAWCQGIGNGDQDYYLQYNELRARAVRRLIIE